MADPEAGWPLLLVADRVCSRDRAIRTATLANRLTDLGLDVRVLCAEGGAMLAARGCEALECAWLGSRWLRHLAARQLRNEDDDFRPRLVHSLEASASESAAVMARLLGVPYVVSVADYGDWMSGPSVPLEARCRWVIVGSDAMATALVRERGIPRARVRVVPPLVELPEHAIERKGRLGVPVIGTAGPWSDTAGVEDFLDAAAALLARGADVEFVVAGEGGLEREYRRRVERLGIGEHVTFAPSPAVDECFWAVVDLYCQPAVGPTLGLHLATAMAAGLPCIATELDDTRRMLADDRGLLVPSERPDALAQALEWGLANLPEIRERAARGRTWVESELDPVRVIHRLCQLYDEVTEESMAAAQATGA